MEKRQLEKIIMLLILTTAVIFAGVYLKEKFNFPVSFRVCGLGYVNCHTVAKFDDRDSCEITNKKWGWYCDETDKNNIVCQDKESDVSIGYCN